MKIRYFEGTDPDYPHDSIVCLSDFDKKDLCRFYRTLERVILDGKTVVLSGEDYISSSDVELALTNCETDMGIQKSGEGFVCLLTAAGFSRMASMVDHFTEHLAPGKFQWLYDLNTPIDFLLSKDCAW